MKIIGNKSVSKRKFASKVKIPAIFIASILLIGALIPTTLTLFPGQLLNQVLADTVTGTDGDDNLEGSDNDDDIEGKGGNDRSIVREEMIGILEIRMKAMVMVVMII